MAGEDFIRFEQLKKAFGTHILYDHLDLSVRKGETMAILGGSGLGKSVLLKMLIGLMKPDGGSIWFDGTEVVKLSERDLLPIRKRISMLFQGGALFDSLNVAENVAYPLREREHLSEEEIRDRVHEKLALVGLDDAARKFPSELSGGMKKRVALARAIASEPEVLLYDEPTTGLDPLNTRRISELIRSIQEQMHVTSIVVTHDLASASWVADRMALLSEGHISAVMPTAELLTSDDPEIREFVDAMPMPEPLIRAQPAQSGGASPP